MKSCIEQIIHEIVPLLEVQYIYTFGVEVQGARKNCLLVIQKDADKPKGDLPSVSAIFAEHPQYLYRIYPESYAKAQLAQGNIFFLHACLPKHLHYSAPGAKAPGLLPAVEMKRVFDKAKTFFQKEYGKVVDFRDGARFYLEKENLPQAAFMLHQAFELAYRTVELFAMGKEKVCHSIANHQEYIRPFVRELEQLFSPENEQETPLLKLLDIAYRDVRYDRGYHISPEQIAVLQAKLEKVLALVEREFYSRFYGCKKMVEALPGKETGGNTGITDRLKRLAKRNYQKIGKNPGRLWYKADIFIYGPADILYTVSSMLKVCVIASAYADGSFSPQIPQPNVNIQQTLELAIQLLPHDEMELFENLVEASGGIHELLKD
ncbi:HEPN domain-containing protein [Sinomicrobium sp. M5D2P9]